METPRSAFVTPREQPQPDHKQMVAEVEQLLVREAENKMMGGGFGGGMGMGGMGIGMGVRGKMAHSPRAGPGAGATPKAKPSSRPNSARDKNSNKGTPDDGTNNQL